MSIPQLVTVELTRKQYVVQGWTNYDLPLRYSVEKDYCKGKLRHKMVADVFGQNVKTIVVKHPETWREAVKERFAPEWFRRRWPAVRTSGISPVRIGNASKRCSSFWHPSWMPADMSR